MVYCVCCGGSSATRGADGINPTSKTAWAMNRLKKNVGYYTQQQEKFYQYLNVNKFFPVLEMLDDNISADLGCKNPENNWGQQGDNRGST